MELESVHEPGLLAATVKCGDGEEFAMTTEGDSDNDQTDKMSTSLPWQWIVTLTFLFLGEVTINFVALFLLGFWVMDVSCNPGVSALFCRPGMRILADVLPWVGLITSITAPILGARFGKTGSQRILLGGAGLLVGVLVWVGTLDAEYQIMNPFR